MSTFYVDASLSNMPNPYHLLHGLMYLKNEITVNSFG